MINKIKPIHQYVFIEKPDEPTLLKPDAGTVVTVIRVSENCNDDADCCPIVTGSKIIIDPASAQQSGHYYFVDYSAVFAVIEA